MKYIAVLVLMLATGCSTGHKAKKPYEGDRIPINTTIPAEIDPAALPKK